MESTEDGMSRVTPVQLQLIFEPMFVSPGKLHWKLRFEGTAIGSGSPRMYSGSPGIRSSSLSAARSSSSRRYSSIRILKKVVSEDAVVTVRGGKKKSVHAVLDRLPAKL